MSETIASARLPRGMQLVEAFDLRHGGMAYSVTGPNAPKASQFKYFKTRHEAVDHALANLPSPLIAIQAETEK